LFEKRLRKILINSIQPPKMSEIVYWEPEGITYEHKPKRVYCKAIDHRGKPCGYRAVHKDTELCGLHQKFSTNLKVSWLMPMKHE